MQIHSRDDVLSLLRRTAKVLNPNQRIVVMLYASVDQRADGAVIKKASDLAQMAGITAPALSRTRKELVERGWMEEAGNIGPMKIYRLTPKAGEDAENRGRGHLRAVSG
jgi:DNA-binding MarR family transcriptional regulator